MAEDKKKGGDFALPSTGMFAVALAVIGLIWSGPAQLIDERPVSHMESDNDKGQLQDVDARLWQDPLGALEKGTVKTTSQRSDDHAPKKILATAFGKGELPTDSLLMLAVMIPGGPYPEDEEGRRRSRYAVLSGLATLDYTPEDSQHIGYIKTVDHNHLNLPEAVPFELFENEVRNKKIFVLWLDDSRFGKNIDKQVKAIFGQLKPEQFSPRLKVTRSVIGPNKSSQLKMILKEAAIDKVSSNDPTYFAAGATVADAKITIRGNNDSAPQTYHPAKRLWRTIANDEIVSRALVDELRLRQVYSTNDRVLLISEWDTLYGQAFPETFAHVYMGNAGATCQPMSPPHNESSERSRSYVYCINYMRGIDGLLPDEKTKNNETAQEKQKKPDTIQINNNIDRPSGNYQQDYLRRLVDRVRKFDQIIRDKTLPCPLRNNGISAIGVVGTDVYDKLMILQALRPYFPGKIFFTTDLDAAYFSDREQQFTHNLIVGSSFDLNLGPELQDTIPPFRDSYQTSMFLSTKLATSMWEHPATGDGKDEEIAKKLSGWLSEARVFEIGRKNPVDLSPRNDSANSADCRNDVLACANIHHARHSSSNTHTFSSANIFKATALLLGLLLLYRMNWMARSISDKLRTKLFGTESKNCPGKNDLMSMLLFVAIGVIFVAATYLLVDRLGKEEPFFWASGVSIWPSNLLQLSALILSLLALKGLKERLAKTDDKIGGEFLKSDSSAGASKHPEVTALECVLAVHKWQPTPTPDDRLDVEKLWERYVEYGQTKYRNMRAAIGTTIFVLFGTAMVMFFGGQPVPSRGNFSFYTDVTLEILCVISTVFLVMWIVDAARLSSRLIDLIATDKPSKWPCINESEWGWPRECNDYVPYWLDVEFVARHTKAMENFIWYPIPPLLLLGLARSTIFDNWTFSPGLLASIIILLVYLFSVAFILQHVAKTMRKKADEKLEKELRKLRGNSTNNEKRIAQLERMAGEVKNNEEGALTPFLRQPMIQALLAFLSGSGGVAILMERFF